MNNRKITGSHILVFSFLMLIFSGMLLLKLPFASHAGTTWVDALFTATSAVCVTGLIVVDTPVHFTMFGQIVIIILIQLGGIGIMTFAASFIFAFNRKLPLSNRMMMEESFMQGAADIKLSELLRFIIKYTFIFEISGAFLFFMTLDENNLFKRLYFSVFHSVSAFCNAGFSTYSDSLMRYRGNISVNIITMILIIAGGIGFLVTYEIKSKLKGLFFNRRKKTRLRNYYIFSLHTWLVLVTTVILIISGTVLIFTIESLSGNSVSLLESLFQSVTSRTAGFNTVEISNLSKATLLIIAALMFIGGSPGSAAGGIKTSTFAVIISMMFMGRNHFEDVVIRNRQLPKRTVYQALMVFIFASVIIFFTVVLVSAFDPEKETIAVLFESVSAFGTVGLSTGITPYLTEISKIIITITMFCGRIGSLTIFSIILSKEKNPGRLAEERVLIG
ncbi:MAG TPA: potassium transporter TrkG [bacterium]|nr:potassium transporter TrkG [bacterium]HOB70467.1 potassium transporter TrkG [bacterium]HOG43067.1 potassium transporter TrkG [bacterium]HPY14457.1 potassium transporter TrkG [bacterium]HQB09915.1 potassium transporter TrkG [bacterium]